ncbi:MAG: hypothetical protein VR72_18705 [Clostridiaceae bacterium BRH_c20a]|nr:MAG: hypothetical protein VR72_18705 [Clostridiaceae bacterium BRH_c20a]
MNIINQPQTVQELLQWAALFLGKEGQMEGELLLSKVSGYSRAKLWAYPEVELSESDRKFFTELVKLRHAGEPLQYLLGTQSFMGLDFLVNKNVLIPRSDTEVLVEETISLARKLQWPLRILDLCTGSGAIAISLAKYLLEAEVTAVDISREALQTAQANAELHNVDQRVKILQGDLFHPIGCDTFHIITSNPPYITTAEMVKLPDDVKKEPSLALWGGEDGLDFYRRIIKESRQYLKAPGWLLVEIGWLQGERVKELFEKNGFTECQIIKDWAGHDRVVTGRSSVL